MDAPVLFNPFPGLRSFEPEEDYLFFGRDRQIEELLDKLGQTRFLAVVGVSGSGKSSLVKAGMIPALYGGYSVRTGSNWRIAVMRPEDHPFRNLAETLAEEELLGGDDTTGAALLETVLRSSAVGLVDCVRQARLPAKENILVVIDQFEELFRFRGEDKDEALAFVRLLLEAARQETLPIYIAITMRSDFIGDCMRFPDLPEAINCGQYLTPRLSREELRAAIAAPAAVAEGKISHRLLTRLLNDLGDDQDQLPVLQHALMRMWDCRQSDAPIDLIHYENIGGLKTALSRHAEEIYGELDGREQGIAEKLFKLLTDRDAEGKGVRRPARIEEVCAITGASEAEVIAVIEHFRARGRSFLMPPVGVELSGASKIDISHESLMRVWTRLSGWVEDETRDADRFRRLSDAAQQQHAGEAGLLQDPALQIVLDWWEQSQPTTAWATRYSGDFDLAERFLRESKKAREQREHEAKAAHERELEQARALAKAQEARAEEQKTRAEEQAQSARRSLYLAVVAGIVMVVAIVLALIAWKFQKNAVEAQQNAEASGRIAFARQLAADSKDALSSNPQRAMLLAMSGIFATKGVADAEEALRETLGMPLANSIPLIGHEGGVNAVVFSPDGRMLASASEDGTIKLWDIHSSTEQATLQGHVDQVGSVAFAPDGHTLASTSEDGMIKLWDVHSGTEQATLQGHIDQAGSVAFAPDGRTLASASGDGTIKLWDVHSGQERLTGHTGAVESVTFAPDGRTLASASGDGTIKLWDAHSGEEGVTLQGHTDRVSSVAFAPDSRTLASASEDGTIKLWDVHSSTERATLQGPIDQVGSVAFAPDGRTLASASGDGTIKLWDAHSGEEGVTLQGHTGRVSSVAFAPDSRTLASASTDGTVRLWDLHAPDAESRIFRVPGAEPRIFRGHEDWVLAVVFSPDGRTLASAGADDTVRVWDLRAPDAAPQIQREDEPGVLAVAFSPDGRILASAGADDTVRVWDLRAPDAAPRILLRHEDSVWAVAFSPVGHTLASASADGTVRVWDLRAPDAAPHILRGHESSVWAVAFSSDGRTLASTSSDRTVRLWDLGAPGAEPWILRGHEDRVLAVAFSPDGRTLASAGADDTVRLWNLRAPGTGPRILRGHEDRVLAVAFSPDGRTLASAGTDRTVQLWNLRAPGTEPRILRGHESSVLAVAFSPDGRTLASAGSGSDRTVRLWRLYHEELIELACRSVVRNLTISEWWRYIGNRQFQLACTNRPMHESFLKEGYKLADSGDFDASVAYFRSIQNIDPRFDFDFVIDEARHRAAKSLTKQSGRLAEQGEAQAAIEHYRRAKQLDPDTEFKPPDFAKAVAAKSVRLARQGHIERALEVFTRSWLFNPDLRKSAKYWNFLCWHGSLWNQAKRVIDACENAVRLAPDDGRYRDSHGVARALLGDYRGAVDDLQYWLKWSRENHRNRDLLHKRENWIKELEAGRNPFDEETLAELRQTE